MDKRSKTEIRYALHPNQCKRCGRPIELKSHQTLRDTRRKQFCSTRCSGLFTAKKIDKVDVICLNCNKKHKKSLYQLNKYPKSFCSSRCVVTYNNNHKKWGTKRAKLEVWLENQLINLYPNLNIQFNRKDIVGSELDIYIPSLNLAIELNGIFHYEPIFGKDKLEKIQSNDNNKFKACIDAKVNLCIIDTTHQKYFRPKTSLKYLSIICDLIDD